ncbi:MAG: hypothetical protein HZB35_04855 [Nitrospirae bacterium]|nr:hypothetical protein [Nitrospirota bacterium]
MNRLNKQREGGFSSFEVLTVVSIIGIATAMVVPNYIQLNERSLMKQATSELHSNINVARMSAMNQNTTVNVNVAMSAGRVTATFTNPSGGDVMAPQVLRRDITGFSGATQVRFSSLGLRLGGGGGNQTITLQSRNGLNYDIQITPAGKTRWCSNSPCPA